MQAQGRRKGSASTESEARSTSTPRNPTPSRSQSANRRAAALGGSTSTESSGRSGSQPKQRGKSTNTNNSNSSSSTDKTTPTQTPFEVALARIRKLAAGKTDDQLELVLQQLLQQRQFEDAAYLIASSATLAAKYKTADVIRLLLDTKQFDKAAQLMRDIKLTSDQLLVTLFIKELVRASLFQSAVRYAQEMVHHFGKPVDALHTNQTRPSWTPQALIQAMIRAQQFRSALKYAKQFELLDLFPPAQLIASLFDVRRWDEAVSSVLEFRLFQEFPLELLVPKLLENRQWSNAVKCINKLSSPEITERAYEALVREAARVGDFITAIRYLREFKLDQPETHGALLQYCVDCMVAHGEFYKAIKYSIKFGLHVPPPDAEETGELSVYDTDALIRQAIASGQFHVAVLYIKKLKLHDKFTHELSLIQQQQVRMVQEFHQFTTARAMQFRQPHMQSEIAAILRDLAVDEKVDQVVEVELVLSVEEEIFPRKPHKTTEQDEVPSGQPLTEDASSAVEAPFEPPRRSSRFSFARPETGSASTGEPAASGAPPPVPQQQQSAPQQMARAPPPGLVSSMPTPPPAPAPPSAEPISASSFDFAQFAAHLHTGPGMASLGPPPPPSSGAPPPSPQPPQGMAHLFPHQASSQPNAPHAGGFYPPPPPPPPPFGGPQNQHGFSGPPLPPPPPPQQQPQPMYYQSSQPGFSHPPPPPPPNGSMAPPPMPHLYHPGQSGGPSNGSFDVSSLAMQFHARPQIPGFGNGYNQFSQGAPPPPPMPPGMPGGLFPTMGPPGGPGPMTQFPPQPQFSFKPTVSYTSVTTTRQKKP